MNRCHQFLRQIDDHVTGRCDPASSRRLAAHAAACPACRREEAAARAARAAVRQAIERAQAQADGPPEPFLAAVHARIEVEQRRSPADGVPARIGRRNASLWAVPAFAAVLVALLGMAFLQWRPGKGDSSLTRQPLLPIAPSATGEGSLNRDPSGTQVAAGSPSTQKPGGGLTGVRTTSALPIGDEKRTLSALRQWGDGSVQRREMGGLHPHSGNRANTVSRSLPHGGDLAYLNADPLAAARPWAPLPAREVSSIEQRLRDPAPRGDDFVHVPFPRLVAASPRQVAAAAESYRREAAVVDPRLSREVTVQQKAIALTDLCQRLKAETGIHLTAGRSVADEKVTFFCRKQPLREVMRQLSRPFGYAWLRSGTPDPSPQPPPPGREGEPTRAPGARPSPPLRPGEGAGGRGYRYELAQDLKSQLLEEELRNRDRNEALLALEREMDRYRPYLELSPDEALRRARSAAPADRPLLEKLADSGWGPIHMYFRLSPREMASLREGQTLTFRQELGPGAQLPAHMGQPSGPPLSSEIARNVLQGLRNRRVVMREGRFWNAAEADPNSLPLTAVPQARALISLKLNQGELGQFTVTGNSGFVIFNEPGGKITLSMEGHGPYALGLSPAASKLDNRALNPKLAGDPALRGRITLRPQASCGGDLTPPGTGPHSALSAPPASPGRRGETGLATGVRPPSPRGGGAGGGVPPQEEKVTSADVLEALHRATGLPIVADFYTRLHAPQAVSAQDQSVFAAVCDLADRMRLRWNKEGSWLQFRSASYYDDRLKEVPNRLLSRWSASRQRNGALTLDDLLEIAGLSDAPLDAADMAEGARHCWGLREWDLARGRFQRPHLRFLAQLAPAQRQEAMSEGGLPFTRMSLAQQQRFVALPTEMGAQPPQSLEALAGAALRLAYTHAGGFQVQAPPPPGGPEREPSELALVWERTRAAALQAARRLNPAVEAAEIVPTETAVTVMYRLGRADAGGSRVMVRATPRGVTGW